MLSILGFVYITCGLIYGGAMASSLEEVKVKFSEIVFKCLEEYPISPSDLESLHDHNMPDNEAAKCLFACAYKKSGMMDEKGNLSIEGVREVSKKYLSDAPDMIKKSEEFTEACESVNDAAVSDGEKGCERAALLFKCSVEKAPGFNFA